MNKFKPWFLRFDNNDLKGSQLIYKERMEYMKNLMKSFIKEEDGIGVVEIILILVVLIGLVIIFRTNIISIVENIFTNITKDVGKIKN